jgi:hypothetical protein
MWVCPKNKLTVLSRASSIGVVRYIFCTDDPKTVIWKLLSYDVEVVVISAGRCEIDVGDCFGRPIDGQRAGNDA